MALRLLAHFESLFRGKPYLHRVSTHGDRLAREFYEDLYLAKAMSDFSTRVDADEVAYALTNKIIGKRGRRGDGAFGEVVPYAGSIVRDPGYKVGRAEIATLEIGAEVKILAKALVGQIDRVQTAMLGQAAVFKKREHTCITVGFVGVNHATRAAGYEGDRVFVATGSQAPSREAPDVIRRLQTHVEPAYDEFLILDYIASNEEPFQFAWVDANRVATHYGALLVRVLKKYGQRFG